jgi:hypothetical protein
MGFNIGISAKGYENDPDCFFFIDPTYYTFVASYHRFGIDSVIIQTGRYFQLDLTPLTRLVYTWEEVTDDYIEENLQDLETIRDLVQDFHTGVTRDLSVVDKVAYKAYDDVSFPDEALEDTSINPYDDVHGIIEQLVQERYLAREREKNNPNPWKEYFETGQILEDLQQILRSLEAFQERGVKEIYFDAG